MKLLITGFTPFNNESINPSYEAVKLLPNKIKNIDLVKAEIPTSYDKSFRILKNLIKTYKPDYIINVGQAGFRKNVTIEKVAINYMDANIPDNDGLIIKNKKIKENGPDAYFTTLPIYKMITNTKNEYPVGISLSAGSYICNYVMYNTLYYIKKNKLNTKAGFIHVPFEESQVKNKEPGTYSMKLTDIAKVLEKLIENLEDDNEGFSINI